MNGLDLFSGIGGITKALEGYVRPVAYCENDRYAQGVLLSRMATGDLPYAAIWDDIRTLKGDMLPVKPDIIYGGFPCQDISVAGRGAGLGGERSGLFFEIARLVGEIRPRFVFLENVAAITVRGAERVVGEFCKLRYDCRWGILSAADVGANHQRQRWWLLGYSKHDGRPTSKEPGGTRSTICDNPKRENETSKLTGTSTSSMLAHDSGVGFQRLSAERGGWWQLEPDVGRVASRLPTWLDDSGGKYAHKSCIKKARTTGVPVTKSLREMWEHREGAEASSRSSRCHLCQFPMSEVPCEGASGSWDVGSWEQEDGGLHSLRYGVYAEAVKSSEDLRSDLPLRTWAPICEQTLASRVDRLKCLGNAVVPAQAREAFERLMGLK